MRKCSFAGSRTNSVFDRDRDRVGVQAVGASWFASLLAIVPNTVCVFAFVLDMPRPVPPTVLVPTVSPQTVVRAAAVNRLYSSTFVPVPSAGAA